MTPLFGNFWQTPGPGVEKDEPAKKGPARYFEVLLRDAGTLWKAGALFCLCCVPAGICAAVMMLWGARPAVFAAGLAAYAAASLPVGPAMAVSYTHLFRTGQKARMRLQLNALPTAPLLPAQAGFGLRLGSVLRAGPCAGLAPSPARLGKAFCRTFLRLCLFYSF